tara:strand:+ start:140 stop:319 length:180 start_codon:yes stop_codon:yes gene_type:complete
MRNNTKGFYRNKSDLISIENIEVDAGSLWKFDENQNLLILDDDDQYATAYLDENFDQAL